MTKAIIERIVNEKAGGNKAELARMLGDPPQNMQHWIRRGQIPLEAAVAIEKIWPEYTVEEMSPKSSEQIRKFLSSLTRSTSQ